MSWLIAVNKLYRLGDLCNAAIFLLVRRDPFVRNVEEGTYTVVMVAVDDETDGVLPQAT